MNDVENDVRSKSNAQIRDKIEKVKADYTPDISLDLLAQKYEIKEINVVNKEGIIKKCIKRKRVE